MFDLNCIPKVSFISSWLIREIQLNWHFIKRDILAVIPPGIIFTATAWQSEAFLAADWAIALAKSALYFWLCLNMACIANQLGGIEEDRLNKPDRPLVAGLVSYQGAQIRCLISFALVIAAGSYLGILEWSLLGVACIIGHDFWGGSKYWLSKNSLIALAMVSILAAAWQIVTPLNAVAWQWIGVFAGVWLILAHVQDLRDIEGDRATNRKTFPLIFGETNSRIFLALGFGLLSLIVHVVLMVPAGNSLNVWLWDAILAIASWYVAFRILAYRQVSSDRLTYKLFTGWQFLLLIAAYFTMPV